MSRPVRTAVFLAAAVVAGGFMVWGLLGLPGFGHYPGPYGYIIQRIGVPTRRATDLITAVMFDYRGLDTLGEEFILFAAATGVVMLLRETRGEGSGPEPLPREKLPRPKSAAVVLLGLLLAPFIFAFGWYMTIGGHFTVGGGFQGGIAIASAWLVLHLVDERRLFHRLSLHPVIEALESLGAAGYVAIGLGGLFAGATFLYNFLPLGQARQLLSAGTIALLNFVVGIEVMAAFVLLGVELTREVHAGEEEAG